MTSHRICVLMTVQFGYYLYIYKYITIFFFGYRFVYIFLWTNQKEKKMKTGNTGKIYIKNTPFSERTPRSIFTQTRN